jgi:MFS family permease
MGASVRPGSGTLRATVLGNRHLALLELGWAASSVGNWAFSIVLAIYAFEEGGAGGVALSLVVRMAPAGLAAPSAAMLADRTSRRRVLVGSALVRTAALAGIAVAVAGEAPLAVVLVLAAVTTVATTAHRPAQAALMAQLARTPAELAAANAVWGAVDYGGFLLGGLLAGGAVTASGFPAAFAACAAATGATAAVVRRLPADPRPEPVGPAPGVLAELLEGARTVWADPTTRLLMGLHAVAMGVMGMFDVLVVVAAVDVLGLGEGGAAWMNAAWGVGGVLGGAATLVLMRRGRLASGLVAGMVVAGAAFATVGEWSGLTAALAALVVVGVGYAVVEAALLTLIQRMAADDVAARVFGVQETIEVAAVALGSVIAATLVDVRDPRTAIAAAGAALPVVAALAARRLADSEDGVTVPERSFELIRRLPVFSQLPIATLENLAVRLEERHYAAGQRIVVQGDVAHEFFVVADGEVEIEVDGVACRLDGVGGFFGEIALLRDVPRTATVTALGIVTVLVIEREHFLAAITSHARSAEAAEAEVRHRLAHAGGT